MVILGAFVIHRELLIDERIDRSAFDQLRDISELIRAAQDGDIRSDYVLQINQLQLKKKLVSIDLARNSRVEAFRDKYPAIADSIPKFYQFPEYSVTFNAKLIDVQTGRIVWLGSHDVSSRNILEEDISIVMTLRKFVTNKEVIFKFIDSQNTEEQRMNRREKAVSIPEWKYDYTLDVTVTPDLNELELQRQEDAMVTYENTQEKFFSHRDKLLKLVTSILIKTIKGESSY